MATTRRDLLKLGAAAGAAAGASVGISALRGGVAAPYTGLTPPTLDPDAAPELLQAIAVIDILAAGLDRTAPWQATAGLPAADLRALDSATVADWVESDDSPLVSAEA